MAATVVAVVDREYHLSQRGEHLDPKQFHELLQQHRALRAEGQGIKGKPESNPKQESNSKQGLIPKPNPGPSKKAGSKPDGIVLIDCRNDYESNIGHFEGAVKPDTRNFAEFPKWVEQNADALRGRRVVREGDAAGGWPSVE